MRRVFFDDSEPSESEYFEEYDKYNTLTPWFSLIFILRLFIPYCLALEIGIFEISHNVELYTKHFNLDNESFVDSAFLPVHCLKTTTRTVIYPPHADVCKREAILMKVTLLKSMAVMFGPILGGISADLHGRRTVATYASIAWNSSAWIAVFLTNEILFEICHFVTLSSCVVVFSVTVVSFGEIINKKIRVLTVYTIFSYILGNFVFGFMSDAVVSWRHLLLVIACTNCFTIMTVWYTPESPKWLWNTDRRKEAFEQLNEVSGLIYDVRLDVVRPAQKCSEVFFKMMEYLFTRRLKVFAVICVSMWISCMNYNAGRIRLVLHNFHVREFKILGMVAEILGMLFLIPIYMFLGKRFGLLFVHALLTVNALVAVLTYEFREELYFNIFSIVFGLTSINLNILYFLDLFPTFLRATAMGAAVATFGLGSLICNFMANITYDTNDFTYYFTFFILSMLGFMVLFLPSITVQDLPNFRL